MKKYLAWILAALCALMPVAGLAAENRDTQLTTTLPREHTITVVRGARGRDGLYGHAHVYRGSPVRLYIGGCAGCGIPIQSGGGAAQQWREHIREYGHYRQRVRRQDIDTEFCTRASESNTRGEPNAHDKPDSHGEPDTYGKSDNHGEPDGDGEPNGESQTSAEF